MLNLSDTTHSKENKIIQRPKQLKKDINDVLLIKRVSTRMKVGRFTLKDFVYNDNEDGYCCPNGKALKLKANRSVIHGVIYKVYAADKEDCTGCELKLKCMISVNGKGRILSVPIGHVPGNLCKAMAAKIDSEKGSMIYSKRIAIVEPVFANIATHKRMDRFTLRRRIKVNIQLFLYCMIHNIGKIMAYGNA